MLVETQSWIIHFINQTGFKTWLIHGHLGLVISSDFGSPRFNPIVGKGHRSQRNPSSRTCPRGLFAWALFDCTTDDRRRIKCNRTRMPPSGTYSCIGTDAVSSTSHGHLVSKLGQRVIWGVLGLLEITPPNCGACEGRIFAFCGFMVGLAWASTCIRRIIYDSRVDAYC